MATYRPIQCQVSAAVITAGRGENCVCRGTIIVAGFIRDTRIIKLIVQDKTAVRVGILGCDRIAAIQPVPGHKTKIIQSRDTVPVDVSRRIHGNAPGGIEMNLIDVQCT